MVTGAWGASSETDPEVVGFLFSDPSNCSAKKAYCQSMIGITFKSPGKYLDECCPLRTDTDGACLGGKQCHEWWPYQCRLASPKLAPTDMAVIVEESEQVSDDWLGSFRAASSGSGQPSREA